jgi:hypothetical protein
MTKAPHGEKMIEIKLRFWTDDLAENANEILPKNAWTSGTINIERNKSHGITGGNGKPFNSLLDVGAVIEKVLIENDIVLHPSRRMRRYTSK